MKRLLIFAIVGLIAIAGLATTASADQYHPEGSYNGIIDVWDCEGRHTETVPVTRYFADGTPYASTQTFNLCTNNYQWSTEELIELAQAHVDNGYPPTWITLLDPTPLVPYVPPKAPPPSYAEAAENPCDLAYYAQAALCAQ